MTNAHGRDNKLEIGKKGADTAGKEWSETPAEGLQEILPSDDELDRLHQEKLKKIPPSEVQKIIDELNREDAELKKHEDAVDGLTSHNRQQGNK